MHVLKRNCLSCHSETKHKGGLSLHSREAMLKGGDSGPAFNEGNPADSLLLKLLAPEADPHMPPKKQLPPEQIALLAEWLSGGAKWHEGALQGSGAALRPVSLAALPAAWHPVAAMALSPDGKRLAASSGADVLVFEVTPASLILKFRGRAHPDAVQSLAWTPDGSRIVSGAFRRAVVWKPEPLTQEREILTGLSGRVSAVQPLADGQRTALADGVAGDSGWIRLCDLTTGAIMNSWRAHDDSIFAMTLSADGKRLTTAGGDQFVRVWDTGSGTEVLRIEAHGTQILGAALHPDNNQLATGGADRQLKIWDLSTRENTVAIAGKPAAFNALAWTAGGADLLAGTDDGTLVRMTGMKPHTGAQSSDTGSERTVGRTDAPLFCLAAAPDGSRIFAGSATGRILGWNKDGKLVDDLMAATLQPAAVSP